MSLFWAKIQIEHYGMHRRFRQPGIAPMIIPQPIPTVSKKQYRFNPLGSISIKPCHPSKPTVSNLKRLLYEELFGLTAKLCLSLQRLCFAKEHGHPLVALFARNTLKSAIGCPHGNIIQIAEEKATDQ